MKRVNYEFENMRVGKRTDYDKITLEVITDGSITPEEAFSKGVAILMEQFTALSLLATAEAEVVAVVEEAVVPEVTPEATEEETPKAEKKSKKKAE